MGFLKTLERLVGLGAAEPEEERARFLAAWESYGDERPEVPEFPSDKVMGADETGLDYDRAQWLKKLKRVLEDLPESRPTWSQLEAEVKTLGLAPEWVSRAYRAEFTMLVRQKLADCGLNSSERETLELARELTGLSNEEALAILREVTREAQSFFGRDVEGV